MLPFNRHQEILNLLEEHRSMTVHRLAEILHTSEATLRRDLVSLEKQGYVNRVFGGVVLAKYANMHLPLSVRQQENKLAKSQVAAKAVDLIVDGSVILLDGSSSCSMILPHLNRFQKLTIISNSTTLCRAALEMKHTVYCIGGALNVRDYCNAGYYAEQMVSMLHADIMFFSCTGLSLNGEMTGVYEAGISYLHAAMRRASKRYLLCDSNKIGRSYPHLLGYVADIDGVICEAPLPQSLANLIGNNRPRSQGHEKAEMPL